MSTILLHGDMLELLPTLPENSIDSVVCDPPYCLSSITKRFGKQGSAPAQHGTDGAFARASKGFMGMEWDNDIAFHPETWIEVYRVMKPGSYLFSCCGSTTFDMVGYALRRAGFVMHPMHGWLFGQGMPKGHKVDDPAWRGWRYSTQATKPAIEPILMAQKPFSERTGTANVQKWGTGALNIDACRVEVTEERPLIESDRRNGNNVYGEGLCGSRAVGTTVEGRYPANVLHDGSDEVVAAFPMAPGQLARARTDGEPQHNSVYGALKHGTTHPEPRGDAGSAARFFYCAKATKADRCGSGHPTVKPLTLMRYLCRLITPPGGVVLDPFAGSGTTLQAAIEEGFQAIGIEKEEHYVNDIVNRLRAMKVAA